MWFWSNQTSPGARVSLFYITIGSLIVIWTGVWFWYLWDNPPETGTVYYYSTGALVTGFILLVIGFAVGAIARGSRPADATQAVGGNDVPAPVATVAVPASPVVRPPSPPSLSPAPSAATSAPSPSPVRR